MAQLVCVAAETPVSLAHPTTTADVDAGLRPAVASHDKSPSIGHGAHADAIPGRIVLPSDHPDPTQNTAFSMDMDFQYRSTSQ